VLIVGASPRLGAALAYLLLREGALVTISARDKGKLLSIASDLDRWGRVSTVAGDASNPEGAYQLLQKSFETMGGLDHLIVSIGGFAHDTLYEPGSMAEMLEKNLIAPINAVSGATPFLHENSSVVVTSSMSSFWLPRDQFSYALAKAAVNKAIEEMALFLMDKGIRVNGVAPALIEGDFDPSASYKRPKLGTPSSPALYYASVVVWLLRDESWLINGVVIPLDGGFRLKQVASLE